MLLHITKKAYPTKPNIKTVSDIKVEFGSASSVKDLTVQEIAAKLAQGYAIQPGVGPLSEATRKRKAAEKIAEGKDPNRIGTCKEDFQRQTLFGVDIDNENDSKPHLTTLEASVTLAKRGLMPCFMYHTFSSTAAREKFRIMLQSDEEFTDKDERDRVAIALASLFPDQADQGCGNADRLFFGTNKGLLDENYGAVCSKQRLLQLADELGVPEHPDEFSETAPAASRTRSRTGKRQSKGGHVGEPIPKGSRHDTILSYANGVLKRLGDTDEAYHQFLKRLPDCDGQKPDSEIKRIWRDARNYYHRVIEADPDYKAPDAYAAAEFDAVSELQSLEPDDPTDVGQAQLMVDLYGERIAFVEGQGWICFDGRLWTESDLLVQHLAQELTNRQLKEARERVQKAQMALNRAVESGDKTRIADAKSLLLREENFRNFVLSRRKSDRVRATCTEARPKRRIVVDDLDRDYILLNTPDGTVDLRTGTIREHDPADYITKMTGCSAGLEGVELFQQFLGQVCCGDQELADFLQVVAGSFAVGHVFEERLYIVIGEGGNGKSTFFNLLQRVLGSYAGNMSSDVLMQENRTNVQPELVQLRGRRLIVCAELEEGARLSPRAVKLLASTDQITAAAKFKAPITFTPSHTVVLFTNYLPKVGSNDGAVWDRLVLLPFNARFRDAEGEIKNYADHLFEHCGGAVLSWLIEGARQFIANGCKLGRMPQCVLGATAEYKDGNDWFGDFLADCCDIERQYSVGSGELYKVFRAWCEREGERTRSGAEFSRAVKARGFDVRKTKTGARIFGIRVNSNTLGAEYAS